MKQESHRIVVTFVGFSGQQFCSTELSEIGYQSGADNSKIRIVFVFIVYNYGESHKKEKNVE